MLNPQGQATPLADVYQTAALQEGPVASVTDMLVNEIAILQTERARMWNDVSGVRNLCSHTSHVKFEEAEYYV